MAKPSIIHGDNQSRHRRQAKQHQSVERKDSSLSDGDNSDEKKEIDCGSSAYVNLMEGDMGSTINLNFPEGRGGDFIHRPDGAEHGFVVESQPSPPVGGGDVPQQQTRNQVDHSHHDNIGRNVSSVNNGLHHRHHIQSQVHTASSRNTTAGHHFAVQQTSSPNRRRRTRLSLTNGPADHHHNRRRKWTVMQIFRSMLLTGAALYVFVMLRGTQILMQQSDVNDDNQKPSHGRLSDYFPMKLPAGYAAHPAIQGYLRSGETTIDSLAPFIHKATKDSPEVVKRVLVERVTERRKRTRPPVPRPPATSITAYDIVPIEKRPAQQTTKGSAAAVGESILAKEKQLCGVHAREARRNNPKAFLEKDALVTSESKVLITGIISNPLAFHLALTLKERCGVEVLIGIDPMLPNTIRNRIQHLEQMQILASNAPKMQPILVPLLGLDPRVKKSKKDSPSENPMMLELTGELNLLKLGETDVTHIVHLSSSTYQNPVPTNVPQSPMAPKRPLSPYQSFKDDPYEPSLFQIRSSMMAMEQILASVVSNAEQGESMPHLTYASAKKIISASPASEDVVLSFSKLADEVLADTYHTLFGAYSVGVRLTPNAIYGPWDTQSHLHHLLHEAIKGNFTASSRLSGVQELIFVQDAVDAIIAAMQFRSPKNSPTNFDLNGNAIDLSKVSSVAESILASKPTSVIETIPLNKQSEQALQKLEWKPKTPLRDGLLRTLAWILDRANPYGPPPTHGSDTTSDAPQAGTGDALLLANSVSTCASDDLACHAGLTYLPCASECSIKDQCQRSIFDSVRQLAREMTEGCDAVLYTQSLGQDVEDLALQSQFEDDVEPAICNLAFVAQSSPLVHAVIEKIPEEELRRLGVPPIAPFADKLKKLNGRLLYRGWILIWVVDTVSLADSSLMKLSPGRMFADDVQYAVFVEENFTVSPTTDDVRFLISQMDRGATKQRNIYRMVKKDEDSKPKKVKFTIAAQPEKRSSILLSQLKYKISERGRIPQDTKISVMDAVRFMRFEVGSDPTKQKESSAIKRQKEFYRRIPTFVNGKDLRDSFEPIYKYELKHWVRTRWVVHDLALEESRNLRCDWYQEHVQWGSEIDQLSFAAVMARRIIDRRMSLMEPDDRSKPKTPVITELKDVTDHNEWFAMATERNKFHIQESGHVPGVQEVPGDEGKDEADEDAAEDGPEVPAGSGYNHEKKPDVGLYVRIISDKIMSLSRKAYSRYKAELAQQQVQGRK